jgi:hypothetical protein
VLSGSPSLTTLADTNSAVGPYAITAAQGTLAAANYTFAFTNGTLTVNAAVLGVTADPKSRGYGQTNPVFTASYGGFVNGETTNVLSGSPSLTTLADTNSPVGIYAITAAQGTLAANNYTFNFTNGNLAVTGTSPLILSITGAGSTNVVVTWSALSNATYRLQYLTNLAGTNWIDVSRMSLQQAAPRPRPTTREATRSDITAFSLCLCRRLWDGFSGAG